MTDSLRSVFSTSKLFFLVLVLCLLLAASIGPVVAVGQSSAPNAYYGDAKTESGDLVPEGTVIVAVAGQEVKDEITVDPHGKYGGSGGLQDKLRVSSEYDTVTFHIDTKDGAQAAETDNPTAETEQFVLTFPDNAVDGVEPTTTETDTPTETATTTETQTATKTATETATETTTPTATATVTATTTGTATDPESETTSAETSTTTQTDTATKVTNGTETETAQSGNDQITVTDVGLNETTVSPSDVVAVTATVENRGESNQSYRAVLSANGSVVTSKEQIIPANETTEVQFQYQPTETGEFRLSVGGTDAPILTVESDDGFLPSGLLRIAGYIVISVAAIYGLLKGLAVYYGY